jgi:hypothetical protein
VLENRNGVWINWWIYISSECATTNLRVLNSVVRGRYQPTTNFCSSDICIVQISESVIKIYSYELWTCNKFNYLSEPIVQSVSRDDIVTCLESLFPLHHMFTLLITSEHQMWRPRYWRRHSICYFSLFTTSQVVTTVSFYNVLWPSDVVSLSGPGSSTLVLWSAFRSGLVSYLLQSDGLENTFLKGFVSRVSFAADFNNSVA